MSTVAPAIQPAAAPDPRRWAALVILLTGAFLAPLDFFIVNVAMPAITTGLHAATAEVQLVISAYAVVYAVLLITGGRLGDIYGRKRVFLLGITGFAVASALCGLAPDAQWLIAGRVLQALAAAAMAPQALASIHALFPPHERGRALSIFGIMLGLSSIAGQLLGGALVGADPGGFGWRLIFLINLPVAVATIATAIPLLPDTRSAHRPRLDVGGVVLSAATLGAFVVPLILGREQGWPWWAIALLAVSPVLAELFRRYEQRLARAGGDPLIAVEVFQSGGLLRSLAAIGTIYAMAAFFLTFSIYLQAGLGLTAWHAGLAILPLSVGFLLGSTGSPLVARRLAGIGPSLGFLLSATGFLVTSRIVVLVPSGVVPPLLLLGPGLFLSGLGTGIAIPTMVRAVTERVEPHRAGLVGGVVNSTLQVSAALGVAVLGGVFYTVLAGHHSPAAIAHAFSVTLLGVAAAHLTGAVLASGLRTRRIARRADGMVKECEAAPVAVGSEPN
jgi:MFS family permease